jgi:hypothetical protein
MTVLQNVTKGSFLKGSGLLIVLAGAVGVHLTRWEVLGLSLTGVPAWCFGVVAAVGGVLFFLGPMVFGLSSAGPAGRPSGERERMLFLYLRPFELDVRNILQLAVGASAGVLAYLIRVEGAGMALSFLPLIINISKEQGFYYALAPLGEFIACGRPGEGLQPVGAARVYVKGDWKQEITEYMARARLVIVRPGSTPSIQWEVLQVLNTVPLQRILFYLRFRGRGKRKQREYEDFRDCVRPHLPAELPERLGRAQYLIFDASGRPHFLREANRPTELIRQLFSRSGDVTADRFLPILKALGIEPPPRPNDLASSAAHVFLWLSALFSLIVVFAALAWLVLVSAPSVLRLLRFALGV